MSLNQNFAELRKHKLLIFYFISLFSYGAAKASTTLAPTEAGASQPASTAPSEASSSNNTQSLLNSISATLQKLETKINTLNEKLDATQASIDRLATKPTLSKKEEPPKTVGTEIIQHPAENFGVAPTSSQSANDPEAGFINNEATQSYREAMILFQAKKYPEAVLAFAAFTEKYPDHPIAGSAQYFIGESYFKQKEYKLAAREFQRVLDSYDSSPHIADTLRDLSIAEEMLNIPEEATKHRQLLSSLFPQSPAAGAELKPLDRNPSSSKPNKDVAASTNEDETDSEDSHESSEKLAKLPPKDLPLPMPATLDQPPTTAQAATPQEHPEENSKTNTTIPTAEAFPTTQ